PNGVVRASGRVPARRRRLRRQCPRPLGRPPRQPRPDPPLAPTPTPWATPVPTPAWPGMDPIGAARARLPGLNGRLRLGPRQATPAAPLPGRQHGPNKAAQ
ncbi:unnamed protein product, partial [Effrenium voratum]